MLSVPDRNPDKSAVNRFKRVSEAYQVKDAIDILLLGLPKGYICLYMSDSRLM